MNDDDISKKAQELSAVFVEAITASVKKAGSQKNFSEKTGIHQSRISDYINANYDFKNITLGTLIRLFPELEIIYHIGDPAKASDGEVFDVMENRLLTMFRGLNTNEKVQCFELMSRRFGEKLKEGE